MSPDVSDTTEHLSSPVTASDGGDGRTRSDETAPEPNPQLALGVSPASRQALGPQEGPESAHRPTLIIMHASVGSGHRSAANAVAQAFRLLRDELSAADGSSDDLKAKPHFPEDLEVEVLDVLDFGRIVFDGNKAASLFTGATRPIYDLTWRFTLTGRLLWGGGTAWNRIMYPAFTEFVREREPIAIVCTHITAANVAVAARMLTGQHFPIVCVPTDYETEGLWPHLSADLFCVANESMAETLRPRKVPEERILITGIPTRDDFRRPIDRPSTRERIGLPQDKLVVLALAGAYLPRPYVHFRAALDKLLPYLHTFEKTLHFVFVAGNDADYARHLRQECDELGVGNATVFGYVDDMAALMAASDVAICKSGGLTVTECLCAQVPMILMGKAYGQEKVNVQMLTSLGAAMHATTARELLEALRRVARNPESARAMLVNGSFLRRPDAARDIAIATMRLVEKPKDPADARYRKRFLHFYWGGKPAHIR
ncbi:UDP-N-acetylglucosamine--LPS N-acetylglucosamine transferase [Gordonibacter sp. An230]|uniref:glycosyltransferase n=1 Tax=Gordonibacter sp. An230 TaxID=1965592 RepID=UPI000B3980E1|nr:glycosyltransferase [Gordonibacter sp. An230]OUO90927.1 UDP-N-acetylglucosamine--LPS N-acetylglucosamine transferase [Gordonibacter sp. An230]